MSKRLSHKSRFLKYRDETVIQKSIDYARWTLPQLMVDIELNSNGRGAVVERDYQEIGPLLVNNLAAKLTGLLFPASRPFFEAELTDQLIQAATRAGQSQQDLQNQFAKLVIRACKRVFKNASYAQLVQAARHLIVTGNVLTYRDSDEQRITTYGLQSFAVRRDGSGRLLDTVLRERTYIEALAPDIAAALRRANPSKYRRQDDAPPVDLYTRIERKVAKTGRVYFRVTQEADEIEVGTPGEYPEHLCPWQVITWNLIAGENYGRGLVEDYAGGFAKLSDASEAAALYGIEILKVLHVVAPGLGADIDEMATAESGEYVQGLNGSVQAHEAGDAIKLQTIRQEINEVFGNLARAFMYKANTRDAERVTAYELRQDAQEADNVLGGVYSSLAEKWQVPMAHVLIYEERATLLAGLLDGTVKLDIIAGVPALGRSIDLQNLLDAAQDISAIVPAFTALSKRVNAQALFETVLRLNSIDTEEFFLSDAEFKAQQDAERVEAEGKDQLMNAAVGAETANSLNEYSQTQG